MLKKHGENEVVSNVEEEIIFGFHIFDPTTIVQMKNIPPSVLLNFHGMATKDIDVFIFNLIYCVIVMIIQMMHKTLNYFLLLLMMHIYEMQGTL